MLIIGLTGSISSGKTFVTDYLRRLGYIIFDADKVSRRSYYLQDIICQIYEIFPNLAGLVGDNLRSEIAKFIFQDYSKLKLLENIIQPYVRNEMHEFISINQREQIVFLEIPLLFENKMESMFDKIVVTICSQDNLQKRLVARGYDDLKIKQILAKQLSQDEKSQKADFIINTNNSEEETLRKVNAILEEIINT